MKHILRVMVGILVGAYLLLLLVLNFGPSRRMLVGEITDFLARKLQTEVHIGDVQVGLFNRLIVFSFFKILNSLFRRISTGSQ